MVGRISILFALVFLFIFLPGACFAYACSAGSYSLACSACSFDASGNMNGTCSNYWTEWGKKCVAEKRPMLAWVYSEGGCAELDECAAELTACKDAVSVGNDKLDCINPAVAQCFMQSDECVAKADRTCNNDLENFIDMIIDWCPIPIFMILGVPLIALLYVRKKP